MGVTLALAIAGAVNIVFLLLVAICLLGLVFPPTEVGTDDKDADDEIDLPAAFRYLANGEQGERQR